MGKRIDVFPYFAPSDEEVASEDWFAKLNEGAERLIIAHGRDGGVEADQLVEHTEFTRDAYAASYGLSHDMWTAWAEHGFAHRGELADKLLQIAFFWCGVIARTGFIAGAAQGQDIKGLEQLLGNVDLGDGDDMG